MGLIGLLQKHEMRDAWAVFEHVEGKDPRLIAVVDGEILARAVSNARHPDGRLLTPNAVVVPCTKVSTVVCSHRSVSTRTALVEVIRRSVADAKAKEY